MSNQQTSNSKSSSTNQQQLGQQLLQALSELTHLYALKTPQNSKHELSVAVEYQTLLEAEAIVFSVCGQSEAAPYLTSGIKTKAYSHKNVFCFLRNQSSHYTEQQSLQYAGHGGILHILG